MRSRATGDSRSTRSMSTPVPSDIALVHRIVDPHPLPERRAAFAEPVVRRMALVEVVRFLIGEEYDESIGVAAIDDLAIRRRRHSDIALMHRFDRGQRVEPLLELDLLLLCQVVAKPEIDGVNEHQLLLRWDSMGEGTY